MTLLKPISPVRTQFYQYLSAPGDTKYSAALKEHDIFRWIGTVMNATKNDSFIWISDNDFQPEWVPEYGTIPPVTDSNFPKKAVCAHKLAIITSPDDDFVSDLGFDLERYLWNQNSDTVLGKPVHISEFMLKDGKSNRPR